MTAEFKNELKKKTEEINHILAAYLPEEKGFQRIIFEAMNYSIEAGGKRLRPMLMQETFRLFGGQGQGVRPFMAAIEMIHTYSLVHDDLPAMDNDEYRRGKKTTHAVFGETMGILAGDALLNYAFETACGAFDEALSAEELRRAAKALQILSRKAGVYGMVGGQVVDVESEKIPGHPITREKLDFIYSLKTGALIEASMMIGAVLAGADGEQLTAVEACAAKLGLAFQIQDDILDVTATFEELGKPIGSDEKNNKPTYVTYEGLDKAKADVAAFSKEAADILASFGGDDQFLQQLFVYLIDRRS